MLRVILQTSQLKHPLCQYCKNQRQTKGQETMKRVTFWTSVLIRKKKKSGRCENQFLLLAVWTERISNWTCGKWGNMKTVLATVKNTSTSSFESKLRQMSRKCSSICSCTRFSSEMWWFEEFSGFRSEILFFTAWIRVRAEVQIER